MKKKIAIPVLFLFLTLCGFFIWQNFYKKVDYQFIDLSGNTIQSEDLIDKVVIVNFWATWCPPCIREMPVLAEIQKKYAQDVQIIGINYDRIEKNEVVEFLTKIPINYPIVLEKENDLSQFGMINGLPTTIFLYKNKIVKTHTGELFENSLETIINQYKKI